LGFKKQNSKNKKDFLKIEKLFLDSNPFLRDKFDFNKLKGKDVLEIGCGSGVASCLFAKGKAKVTSADITKNAIEITKLNAKLQKIELNVSRQDAEKLTFPDNYFDYVFSWGVFAPFTKHTSSIQGSFKGLKKWRQRSYNDL